MEIEELIDNMNRLGNPKGIHSPVVHDLMASFGDMLMWQRK